MQITRVNGTNFAFRGGNFQETASKAVKEVLPELSKSVISAAAAIGIINLATSSIEKLDKTNLKTNEARDLKRVQNMLKSNFLTYQPESLQEEGQNLLEEANEIIEALNLNNSDKVAAFINPKVEIYREVNEYKALNAVPYLKPFAMRDIALDKPFKNFELANHGLVGVNIDKDGENPIATIITRNMRIEAEFQNGKMNVKEITTSSRGNEHDWVKIGRKIPVIDPSWIQDYVVDKKLHFVDKYKFDQNGQLTTAEKFFCTRSVKEWDGDNDSITPLERYSFNNGQFSLYEKSYYESVDNITEKRSINVSYDPKNPNTISGSVVTVPNNRYDDMIKCAEYKFKINPEETGKKRYTLENAEVIESKK